MIPEIYTRIGAVVLTAVVFACGSGTSAPTVELIVNGAAVAAPAGTVVERNGVCYVAAGALEAHLGLTQKEIVPGKQVGICLDELCIPLMFGDGADRVWQEGGHLYVPVAHVFGAIDGAVSRWDPAARRLELSLRASAGGGLAPEPGGGGGAVDFTLPDLDGKDVALSDFRGKKVVFFCWASW